MNRKPIVLAIVGLIVVLLVVFAVKTSHQTVVTTTTNGHSETSSSSDIQTVDENSSLYDDPGNRFTFVYPKNFVVNGPVAAKSSSWRQNATTSGLTLASITVPKSYMPGTNFSDAKFTVGSSNDKTELGGTGCPAGVNFGEGINDATAVSIHNQTFTKISTAGAGAGNLYQTTSYFTVRGGNCYAVEYTVHSTNLGNYSPDQGIKEFDKAKVTQMFENIMKTFIFTVKSD